MFILSLVESGALFYLLASRRKFLFESTAAAAITPITASMNDSCQNGILTEELAIPGAYENFCMALPIRQINVGLTALSIEQEAPSPGSTGLAVWNSSLLMTRLLPLLSFQDSSVVVELGCGTGLASLVAATLGATRVYATDGNVNVVNLANRNIQRNQLQNNVQATPYKWGQDSDTIQEESADWILGSDLTYNPGSWPLLAEAMASLVKPNTGIILYLSVGHPGFNVQGEIDGFLAVAKAKGLKPIQPFDPEWPLRTAEGTPLASEAFLQSTCRTNQERHILEGGGGVRILLLRKPL